MRRPEAELIETTMEAQLRADTAMVRFWKAARAVLPRGGSLPEESWRIRHRAILALLWLHAIGIAAFGVAAGYGPLHSLTEAGLIGVIAAVAGLLRADRRVRAAVASFGLVTCSAMLVHLSGGYIELHFHFFVMIAVITLYQDWVPFLIAIGYVVLEHGLGGMLMPAAIYNHPDAVANPWKWAAIHGAFVLGESVACIASWRLNEANRRRIESILDSAGDGICGLDALGQITFANPAAARITGYAASELVGRSLPIIHPVPRPEARDGAEEESGRVDSRTDSGPRRTEERVLRRRDGTSLPVECLSTPIEVNGEVVGAVMAFRDISERKRAAATRDYAAALERANRELQAFAYAASHDLQEPLRKVQAFGDRLIARHAESLNEEGRDYVARMRAAAGRMQAMINDLLALSRVTTTPERFVEVDLGTIAREVVSDLETRIEHVAGRVELGELLAIEANPVQMRQLLQNLIANGLKFRRPDVAPEVRVAARALTDGRVELTVRDNGIGFDEKYLDRIFAPFQRLHGRTAYEGTGIGLALCQKIAERHGGTITARSAPDAGATFIVTLPIKQAEQDSAGTAQSSVTGVAA